MSSLETLSEELKQKTLPSINDVDKALAELYFDHFVMQAWHVVEPSTLFVNNWHIGALCEHLEAILYGQISRLIINIPPRHMKSLLCSVFFPAWVWTRFPHIRFLYTSYAEALSIRDSVKTRRIIMSNWYQARWGDMFTLMEDQNQKTKFENDKTGHRMATSIGGSNTGEGGNIIFGDDPNNVKEAESKVKRDSTNLTWDEVISSRLDKGIINIQGDDITVAAKVVIQQRTHEEDVTGYLLAKDIGYEHLCIPCEHDPKIISYTSLDFEDPRKEEGEPLWPGRFDISDVLERKRELGAYAFAGQFQQSPHPRGGGMFEVEKFHIVSTFSGEIEASVRYWDKAGTESGGAYSAGVLMHKLSNGRVGVSNCIRGQWSYLKREQIILQCAKADGEKTRIWVEQEPGSGGKESAERTIAMLIGYSAYKEPVRGDKEIRAQPYSAQVENNIVELLKGDWVTPYISEHESFPMGKYKDQVDASSGAFNKLFGKVKRAGVW